MDDQSEEFYAKLREMTAGAWSTMDHALLMTRIDESAENVFGAAFNIAFDHIAANHKLSELHPDQVEEAIHHDNFVGLGSLTMVAIKDVLEEMAKRGEPLVLTDIQETLLMACMLQHMIYTLMTGWYAGSRGRECPIPENHDS